MMPHCWKRNGWSVHLVAGMAVLGALAAAIMHESWLEIFNIAVRGEENGYILLIPLVAAWLVWVRRERFRHVEVRPDFTGPLLVAMGWAMFLLGYYWDVEAAFHLGAVLALIGAVITPVGSDALKRFAPAFVVLLLMVPVPGVIRAMIANPLQNVLAQLTQGILGMAGLPIEAYGNQIVINGRPVEVAEACNGMRMVFALYVVAYAFAFGLPLQWPVRAVVLAASPVLALVCNFIRMIPTVWVYGYTSSEFALAFHDAAGWVMLAVAFGLLLGAVGAMRWAMFPVERYALVAD